MEVEIPVSPCTAKLSADTSAVVDPAEAETVAHNKRGVSAGIVTLVTEVIRPVASISKRGMIVEVP